MTGRPSAALLASAAIVYIPLYAFYVIVYWRIFMKAGEQGWKSLIPVYNMYVLLRIAGRPGWWLILFIIPVVNIVVVIIMSIDLARSFGKGTGFGAGLALLSVVFYPILAFGNSRYLGPAAGRSGAAAAPAPSAVPPPPPPPVP